MALSSHLTAIKGQQQGGRGPERTGFRDRVKSNPMWCTRDAAAAASLVSGKAPYERASQRIHAASSHVPVLKNEKNSTNRMNSLLSAQSPACSHPIAARKFRVLLAALRTALSAARTA